MRFKNLERFRKSGTGSNMNLAVPLSKTPDGRVYRYSPNPDAYPRHFVLGNAQAPFDRPMEPSGRMKLAPGSRQTVCPYSGVIEDDEAFTHPDDAKAALETVKHAAAADVEEIFHDMFTELGQRHSKGPLTIKVGPRRAARLTPHFSRRDLLRELVCDACGRDYGVFAISLFCPDCGAPNLRLHFAREVALVGRQVELAGSLQAEQEELAYRLLGNAHEDVLTAFEATLKTTYLHAVAQRPPGSPDIRPVRNDFQNMDRGRARFAEFGFDPFASLTDDERATLLVNIQKRHVIGHNLSIADAAFAEHAADAKLGETVPLVGGDIRQFAATGQRVIDGLDTWLGEAISLGPAATTLVGAMHPAPATAKKGATSEIVVGNLSQLAIRVACWMAENSTTGTAEIIQRDSLARAFSDTDASELAEAVAELEADGFATTIHAMGHLLPHTTATNDLFITFDPHVQKTNPLDDAAGLIEMVLTGADSVSVAELHTTSAWPLRRFNPAVALVVSTIDERRVSGEMGGDHPARSFHMTPADRVELKRLLARLKE